MRAISASTAAAPISGQRHADAADRDLEEGQIGLICALPSVGA
jgi:hypothetical protein